MSRVMLFVQTGEGRPKCMGSYAGWSRPDFAPQQFAAWRGKEAGAKAANGGAFYQALIADRWWLVECENAEAGRLIIALQVLKAWGAVADKARETGRILASGGRAA